MCALCRLILLLSKRSHGSPTIKSVSSNCYPVRPGRNPFLTQHIITIEALQSVVMAPRESSCGRPIWIRHKCGNYKAPLAGTIYCQLICSPLAKNSVELCLSLCKFNLAVALTSDPIHRPPKHGAPVLRDERDRYNAGQEGRGFSTAGDGRGCHAGL